MTIDTLHYQAFDHSLQPNIISLVSTDRIISANQAACRLLGYSKDELICLTSCDIFDIKLRSFKKMLKQRADQGRSAAVVNALSKDGSIIPCEITSAVFISEGIEKCITTLVDMRQNMLKQRNRDARKGKLVAADVLLAKSTQHHVDKQKEKVVAENIVIALAKSDARLAEHSEWIKYIAKTSYDVMWDWDVVSGDIYVGDSIEELFGYKVKDNNVHFADFMNRLLPDEKDRVKSKLFHALASDNKSWNDTYLFRRHDGSLASTTSRASIVRDDKRKAIRVIGAIHDVSRLQELENKLIEQIIPQNEDRGKFLLTARFSLDVIWDWKMDTNEIFFGEGFEDLFGHSIEHHQGNITSWGDWLHPEDEEAVKQGLKEAIGSSATHWQQAYRFIRADGTVAKVFDRASIFRHPDGKAYRLIGVMQDISRQKDQDRPVVDLTTNKKDRLIDKIKDVVIELIHYTDEQLQTNFSTYLSNKLEYDYTYLANIFSEAEGITIQQFIIVQKIERVKELIVEDEWNLTEIASKLHYSSVAHLSNQFKKITGFTPSQFRQQSQK